MKTEDQLLHEIDKASSGLLFMSESDYPFHTVLWKDIDEITPEFLRSIAGEGAEARVETKSLDEFFRPSLSEERDPEKRYQVLVRLLKENLEDVRVYRVGEINIPVYIVGRHGSGSWLGVSTRVVET